jgi:anti-anti-sigma factor
MVEPHIHAAATSQVSCDVDAQGRWRIELRGEIDMSTDPQLEAALTAVTAADPVDILVDLTEVTFLASAGLGFLAELRNHADPVGHTVTLHGPDRAVRRALTVVGFDDVFTITQA